MKKIQCRTLRWYFQDYLGLHSRIREWDIPEGAGASCHYQGNNQHNTLKGSIRPESDQPESNTIG
jgi:hypothetical protein